MVKARVLENNSHRTGRDTLTAVCTFFPIDDVCPNLILVNCIFRADLGALAALGADKRPVFARVREFRFDPQGRLLWIYLAEVLDRTYLQAKAAASASVSVYFYPHS